MTETEGPNHWVYLYDKINYDATGTYLEPGITILKFFGAFYILVDFRNILNAILNLLQAAFLLKRLHSSFWTWHKEAVFTNQKGWWHHYLAFLFF